MDLKNNQESFVSADSICCLTKDINFEFPIDFCRTLNSSNLILNPSLQNTKIWRVSNQNTLIFSIHVQA